MAVVANDDIDDQLRCNIRLAYGRKTVRFAQQPLVCTDEIIEDERPLTMEEIALGEIASGVASDYPWMEPLIELDMPAHNLFVLDHRLPKQLMHTLNLSNLIQSYIGTTHELLEQLLVFSEPRLLDLDNSDPYQPLATVNDLPVKRVFDPINGLVRELPKLPKEFELDNDIPQCIFKVKLAAINFVTDFKQISSPIVPGNRAIGKITTTNIANIDDSKKYLVYPISTCLHQNSTTPCANCDHLHNLKVLGQLSHEKFDHYRCLRPWIYGVTIDGGLQEYMKLYYPHDALLAIPLEVLSHDACFMFERSLPLYIVLKNLRLVGGSDRTLMILSDVDREINDILLVLHHFGIDQRQFVFIDRRAIGKLQPDERELYRLKFSQIFVFDTTNRLMQFALECLSNHHDRTVFIFDQMAPIDRTKYHTNQRHFHHFQLAYCNKVDAIELMTIIADLNAMESSYVYLTGSDSPQSSLLMTGGRKQRPTWLYYDFDADIHHDYNDQESTKCHSTRHINQLILHPKYRRVCYKTRSTPVAKEQTSNVIIL